MTRTDQAFIEAYQRTSGTAVSEGESAPADASEGTPTAKAEPAKVSVRHAAKHGPHMHWQASESEAAAKPSDAPRKGRKTPLAEAIAERMRQAATASTALLDAAVQLRAFTWPIVVEQLALAHRSQYLDLAPQSTETPLALGVAGVHKGSGATTTTLALARCLANEFGPLAIIDADAGPTSAADGVAASLGMLRIRTLGDALARNLDPAEAVVHAADDRVSLVKVGDVQGESDATIASAVQRVRDSHTMTLVDFGSTLDNPVVWNHGEAARLANALQLAGVLLVRCDSNLSGAVSAAARIVESAGAPALGLIENRTTHPAS